VHCLQNGVINLENTLRSALVAEVSGVSDPVTSLIIDSLKQNSVASEQQMKTLMDKVNALTLSAANQLPRAASSSAVASGAAGAPGPATVERPDTQSDRREAHRPDDRGNYRSSTYKNNRQNRRYFVRPLRFNPQREQRERYQCKRNSIRHHLPSSSVSRCNNIVWVFKQVIMNKVANVVGVLGCIHKTLNVPPDVSVLSALPVESHFRPVGQLKGLHDGIGRLFQNLLSVVHQIMYIGNNRRKKCVI
jgi:hypothetical protein